MASVVAISISAIRLSHACPRLQLEKQPHHSHENRVPPQ
jgi:hypothetical protein